MQFRRRASLKFILTKKKKATENVGAADWIRACGSHTIGVMSVWIRNVATGQNDQGLSGFCSVLDQMLCRYQLQHCTACLSCSSSYITFNFFSLTQPSLYAKLNSTKFKIQTKCSTYFLCCILRQSNSNHFTFFTSHRSTWAPTRLYQDGQANLGTHPLQIPLYTL